MQMHCCDSSSVEEIGHKNGVLRVKYKSGGTYDFHGVSEAQFHELKGAKSVGKHLHGMGLSAGKRHKE